jgi:hypothetical protein
MADDGDVTGVQHLESLDKMTELAGLCIGANNDG